MSQTIAQSVWSHHNAISPIAACALEEGDLARLFDLLNEKQAEIEAEVLPLIVKTQAETDDQFAARRQNVKNSFTTVVSIKGANGKTLTGNSRNIFDSPLLPERIVSVFFSTGNALKAIGLTPPNHATLFLDFGRPPLLNSGALPSAPTPNESNFVAEGRSEPWVASLNGRLRQFFSDRATARGWIHKRGTYDLLLLLGGFPGAIWFSAKVGTYIKGFVDGPILSAAVYAYLFLLSLSLFRAVFDYARWVFPLIELKGRLKDITIQQRGALWLIIVGVLSAAGWDLIKALS